jgi:hypothetical protein
MTQNCFGRFAPELRERPRRRFPTARPRWKRLSAATAKGAASAIATWLMSAFAIANPFAIALAAFVTILISSAAPSAFCTMTDEEVLDRLRPATAS